MTFFPQLFHLFFLSFCGRRRRCPAAALGLAIVRYPEPSYNLSYVPGYDRNTLLYLITYCTELYPQSRETDSGCEGHNPNSCCLLSDVLLLEIRQNYLYNTAVLTEQKSVCAQSHISDTTAAAITAASNLKLSGRLISYYISECVPLFRLAAPPGFQSNHIPKGILVRVNTYLVCTCTSCTFFAHGHAFLFRPRVFSRALGCEARREPACTLLIGAWAPVGLRGARCGRSKLGRAGSFRGIAARRARAKQDDGNPHKKMTFFRVLLRCITARTSETATLQEQPRFKIFPLS